MDTKKVRALLTLMMAVDAIRSAKRWFNSVEGKTPEGKTDVLMSMAVCAGWGWEGIVLVRKLAKSNCIVRKKMLADYDLEQHWQEFIIIKKKPTERVERFYYIRQKAFGHFDLNRAGSSVSRFKGEEPKIAVASRDGKFIPTPYDPAYVTFGHELFGDWKDTEGVQSRMNELVNFISLTERMIDRLLEKLARELGLTVKSSGQVESDQNP